MAGTRRFKKKFKSKKNLTEQVKDDRRNNYSDIVRVNEDFVKYYKAQRIIPEEKWDEFINVMRTDLPTAFRITGNSKNEAKQLLNIVQSEYFSDLLKGEENSEGKEEPKCLSWYPENLGWQLELTRKDIRRSEKYFRIHNFLISETATGNISRQETVSMIPPLLLDIKSHHKILDMCAAPGSKTAQIIEMLHSGTSLPSGFVVANDIDNSRCYMLVHQAKRLNSPSIIITNHDSSVLPNFILKDKENSDTPLKYDRILCDVPCTGDGTLRKNPDIWQKWNAANGSNLHGVQFRILKRGVELLKIGGRIVYSTCSLNPLENEAVIHRILNEAGGSLELIDISDEIKGLIYDKGISTWYPASKDLTVYTKFDEVEEKWHTQLRPQMFPPEKENAEKFHLHRCLRILPHHQNTGGFFVAVIRKTNSLPWESDKTVNQDAVDKQTVVKAPPQKRRKIQGYREDPYVFFTPEEEVWKSIKAFYGIENLDPSCLLTRCLVGKKKNIYFTSPSIKDIVNDNQKQIKIINTGVKVFARCGTKNTECDFRLVHEGLNSIQEFITLRRIKIPKEDLVKLLNCFNPNNPPLLDDLTEETRNAAENLCQGSCILIHDGEVNLTMVGWKGKQSLRAYVSNQDAVHYLRILGEDVSLYDVNKFKKDDPNGTKPTENDKLESDNNVTTEDGDANESLLSS